MRTGLDPFSFLVVSMAGWLNQKQQVIDYLVEENRVLRGQIGVRRLRFNDDQRRRLAAKAKKLGPENSGAGRHNRHTANAIGVASEIDRPEI
jgi:hypothetical protein